jgi:hypothetical protein
MFNKPALGDEAPQGQNRANTGGQCCKTFSVSKLRILRFVHTRDVDLAISLSDAISIEILPSFQIATAGDSGNM